MPQGTGRAGRRRIAVVGGGISGLAAAYMLADRHDVVLYESEPRLGGHARTVLAGRRGDQPVDTGFIVFNRVNYPRLVNLFEDLEVPVAESDMSFAASIDGGRLEFGLRDLRAVFAQKRNLCDPRFWSMLRDVLRFNARALAAADGPDLTIGDLLDRLGTGAWFRDYYLLPLAAAIWSTPAERILDFPAQALVRFFDNHALLHHTGQHRWYTVRGGSAEYVRRLQAALVAKGVALRLAAPVATVAREPRSVRLRVRGAEVESFDQVVFATHADDTLRLLSDVTGVERAALTAVRYQGNRAVLHADPSVMPVRRGAWASWNYAAPGRGPASEVELTYWMNSLQPIPQDDPLFVTLNPRRRIDPALIYDETEFRHPVYDREALAAQDTVRAINGMHRTWFCGAWMGNGFHEDGVAAAAETVSALERARPQTLAVR